MSIGWRLSLYFYSKKQRLTQLQHVSQIKHLREILASRSTRTTHPIFLAFAIPIFAHCCPRWTSVLWLSIGTRCSAPHNTSTLFAATFTDLLSCQVVRSEVVVIGELRQGVNVGQGEEANTIHTIDIPVDDVNKHTIVQ